jgi:hypothetical protein
VLQYYLGTSIVLQYYNIKTNCNTMVLEHPGSTFRWQVARSLNIAIES